MKNPLAKYPLTQSWEAHLRNAGPTLGGEDYAMPSGTPLPVLDGVLEWVTPSTARKPAWYNLGLGNAAAYRRPDGTRTVYAHCSKVKAGVVLSGNTGKVKGSGHVHVHDVDKDGTTRRRPFSTIRSSTPEENHVYNLLIKTKDSADLTKREYEVFTPYGPGKIVGHATAEEHNKQTGAPAALDGTSKKKNTVARVARVRALWKIQWDAADAAARRRPTTP